MRRFIPLLLTASLFWVALPFHTAAQEAEAAPVATDGVAALLDSIREDLVELRFEKALAALEGLLGNPGMSEAERGEALVLRAQTHVAFGDLDAAEADYRQILELRPGYEPAPSLTPEKARVRFRKVQASTVGHVVVELDPADARLEIDGREIVLPPDRRIALRVGIHGLRAQRAGHDPLEQEITVAAGEASALRLELVPNARTVVLRTLPDGVEVLIDGRPVGVTARRGMGIEPAGELIVENVPLGEHVYELSKECYRTERVRDTLTVDLLDRSPRRFDPVRLVPVRSTLILRGGPRAAEVRLDGAALGRLPLDPQQVCPGVRDLEVALEGRTLWRSVEGFEAAAETVVEIEPRPNLALVGAESWPRELEVLSSRFNTRAGLALPATADLSKPASWGEVALAPDTDLAVAIVAARREGAADRWYLYTPILRRVVRLDRVPEDFRPSWSRTMWGFSTVDAADDGPVLAAVVTPSGPAAAIGLAPGDRLVSLGGRAVESTDQLLATLASASRQAPIELEWLSTDGKPRKGGLRGSTGPLLVSEHATPERAAYLSAWAVVDVARSAPEAAAARANLALLFSAFGHHELAVETWRKVAWGDRSGIGEGTTQYYLGRALQQLGREDEAVASYRKAAASEATTFHDEGPPVAPVALDRLADLGQTARPPSAR